jgi:hypothetical protein
MSFHLHIVGSSERSGTTLLQQMLLSCYSFDDYSSHERSIVKGKAPDARRVCTKKPNEADFMELALAVNPKLYCLYIVRDPRDVVCSELKMFQARYYTNLRLWRQAERAAARLSDHPRFLVVRYEDLVRDPDAVQDRIEEYFGFLERQRDFSRFHEDWRGDEDAVVAMNGVRPPDPASIGRWREDKARVARQIALHGDITDALVARGYEADGAWVQQLPDAEPVAESYLPDRLSPLSWLDQRLRRLRRGFRYWQKMMQNRFGY